MLFHHKISTGKQECLVKIPLIPGNGVHFPRSSRVFSNVCEAHLNTETGAHIPLHNCKSASI